MGFFSRLGSLIKSNLNDLISKAEDPEKMLNQVLVDMKTQLVEAKKQVAVAIGDEKRLKKQWDEQVALSKDWERKAMLAVQAGDDELAKEALLRQRE
ncbi:MAG TPA: PspA/IM30 family protein, partial [Pseudomonadota bacterium]|nr:PspA/IM30 family protein [Pseudomonadota bacterium]